MQKQTEGYDLRQAKKKENKCLQRDTLLKLYYELVKYYGTFSQLFLPVFGINILFLSQMDFFLNPIAFQAKLSRTFQYEVE